MLQRNAPTATERDADNSPTSSPKSPASTITRTEVTSNIDPALSSVSSPGSVSESGDSARDRAEEAWIENIRVIEALRKLISDKLERKEYEDDEDTEMGGTSEAKEEKISSAEVAYPTLRADDD